MENEENSCTIYHLLFNTIEDCVAIYEAVDNGEDFRFSDLNRAAEIAESVKKEELIGKLVTEAFPAVKDFGIFSVFQDVYRSGSSQHFPLTFYEDNRINGWRDNYIYKIDEMCSL